MFRDIVILALILAGIVASPAAQLKEARVTEVVKDVKLLPTGSAPRPAAVSDEVRNGTAVRTGVESRSELKFPDQTLARLGANTVFSFSEGTRSLNLQDGAMLLRVPKGAGGAKISSSAITAAITGTTVMVETHPLTKKGKDSYYKFIVLEGTARLSLPGQLGESVLVKAGQMIIMPTGAKKIPEAADVDIQKIMQSSLLITGFGPLGSEQLIALEQTRQFQQKTSGQLHETNLMIAGGGTNVILGDPNQVDVAVTAQKTEGSGPFSTPTPTPSPPPTPTPSATPSKFGTPVPITSPDPYVITSGTTITTDPSITTNGVTDSGKIYRGAETDGPASAWAFGSTSTFDTSSGFDSEIIGSGAAFKFTALELAGNPTISTANGEINLGLIAVNGITSGSPGGVLTFAGIRGLLLATQNGSIALGPEISFSGLHDITLYARGAGSVLTLASDISTTSDIRLYGENAILVTGNLSTQRLIAAAGENISIVGGGSTTINASEASLLIPNSGSGNIPDSATIALVPAGNLVLNGSNGLSLTIDDTNGGHIGQDANILLTTTNLNAGSLNITSGGFIEGDILTINGGHIGGNASILLNATGDINGTQGIAEFVSLYGGGQIDGSALVVLSAQNIITASTATGTPGTDRMALEASIYSNVAGTIGGDATVSIEAAQDITAPGKTLFWVANGNYQNLGPGTIGGNAEVIISATNISTGDLLTQILNYGGSSIGGVAEVSVATATLTVNGSLDSRIDNTNGTISGDATLDYSVSGTATITGDALFQIVGSDGAKSAAINISGGSYSVGGTFLGNIDGSGTFTLNATIAAGDAVKIGVFGTNGTLRIGGGSISASTLLHLYAPGSNGIVDFVGNVTLNSSTAPAIAGNTVRIENGVVVTILGVIPANVFTNLPEYSGSGGNGSTSGRFAGAGATKQPLGGQPAFAAATRAGSKTATRTDTSSIRTKMPTIHVSDSSQLGALLNSASPGKDRTVRVPAMQGAHHVATTFARATPVNPDAGRVSDAKPASAILVSRVAP
jgi:FecR protein